MDEPLIDEISGADEDLTAALKNADLPIEDLTLPGRRFFRFHDGNHLVGFVGWEEGAEGNALLRSLIVLPECRNRGLGVEIAHWALTRLAELGFTDIWFLTTTAEALALKLGFQRVDRETAPPSVRHSRQFAGLCPTSATLLHRSLP